MSVRPKRVPRLWCARLGLLPFDVVLPSEMASRAPARDQQLPAAPSLPSHDPASRSRPGEQFERGTGARAHSPQ